MPAVTAARSSCASRTPTSSARPRTWSPAFSTACGGSGSTWDEGPDIGGPHAPYFQSERLDRYRDAAARGSSQTGTRYYCYCSPERLREERERAEARGEAWQYDRACLRASA